MPDRLKIIHEQAFEGTSAVKKVVVPDGTKCIESRAFADSGAEEVYLPESIEFIADDAFAGCDDITVYVPRDSEAHRILHDGDVRYSIVEDETVEKAVYAVYGAEYVQETDESGEYAGFVVTVDTAEACDVQVALFDEASNEVLLTFGGSADANLSRGRVKTYADGEFVLPEHYILEAKLIGADGALLCSYTSHKNSARRAEIENRTADDYSGEIVSFGDAGYGVLEEGVVQLDGVQSGSGYIVEAEGISAGDVLLINLDGRHKAVKVKTISDNGDGTVTVLPDDSIEMGEVYQRLDISGYMQPVGGAVPAYTDDSKITVIPLNPSFGTGPLSITGKIEFTVKMDFVFDKKEDYFSAECWAGSSGNVEVALTGGFNTRTDLDKRIAVPLYDAGVEIPGTDIEAKLEVSLPLDLDFSAGGTAHVGFESKTGFKYNSDDRIFEKIDEDSSEAYAKVKGKLTITAGPEIMFRAELMDWLDAKIWGQIGLEAVGEVKGLQYGGSSSTAGKPDSIHACGGCVDCDVNLIAGVWGTLECTALEKLDVKLFDEELFVIRGKIGDAFYSFINEKESPYGGADAFGFGFVGTQDGVCQNVKYRADITTEDYTDTAVRNIPVTSTGVYGTVQTGKSPCTMYLYPGSNAFSAQFRNGTVSVSKTMPKNPAGLLIKEQPVTINAIVTDEKTGDPISGARVTLVKPDGSTKTGVTGAKGIFTFSKLPAGSYSLKATAEGYEDKTILAVNYTSGMNVNSHISMTPMEYSTISGKVIDKATGLTIPGATVTLNLPGGGTKTTSTGADGWYKFEELLPGSYTLTFSKDGYETTVEKNQPLGYDTDLIVYAKLEPRAALPFLSAYTSGSEKVQALTADGTCPDGIPEVCIETNIPSSYYGVTVSVSHSDCADTLDVKYSQAVYSLQIQAADMGSGEYIYILSAVSAGRMGGEDHTVFRVRNGKFEILGEFDMDTHSMDIGINLDAKFTSTMQLAGTLEPSGKKFVIDFFNEDAGERQVGNGTSRRRLGYLDFVENEDGYYDMEFRTDEFYGIIQSRFFAATSSIFVMENGSLVLDSQSLTAYSGSVSEPL